MSDLGGFVEGAVAGQQYRQAEQLFGFTLTQEGQKVDMNRLSIQDKELAVKTGQIALDQQVQMLQRLTARNNAAKQGGQVGSPGATPSANDAAAELANNMMEAAKDEIAVGRYEEGSKHANQASEILKRNSEIAKETHAYNEKLLNSALSVVKAAPDSQAGWDQAKFLFQTEHPQEADNPNIKKIFAMPWKPGLMQALQKQMTTQLQDSEITKNRATAVHAYAASREADFRTKNLLPAQTRAAEARAANYKKIGAGHLAPKPTDVREVVNRALQKFPDAADDTVAKAWLYTQSQEVAARALELEKVRGVPRAEAQDKAFREAWDNKHYAGMPRKGQADLGTSVEKPFPAPDMPKDWSTMDTKAKDKWINQNLKKNMFYSTKNADLPGGIGVWNGTGFDPPEDVDAAYPEDDDSGTDE